MVAHACNPSTWGVEAGRPEVQEQSGLFWDLVSRKDKAQTTETAQQFLARPQLVPQLILMGTGRCGGWPALRSQKNVSKVPHCHIQEPVWDCEPHPLSQCTSVSVPAPLHLLAFSTFMNPNFVRTPSQKSRVGFQAIWPNTPSPF